MPYTPGFQLRILAAEERCNITGEYLKEAPHHSHKQPKS